MILAILAAGGSRRFGDGDKLTTQLGGKMLGLHVAEALQDASFEQKCIVTSVDHPCAHDWAARGYKVLVNENAAEGQATSVALAARHAKEQNADALCICLADMPFVTAEHIGQLQDHFARREGTRIVASSDGDRTKPPAIFPSEYYEKLIKLKGDSGARSLLVNAEKVRVNEGILMDIDTPENLAFAENKF